MCLPTYIAFVSYSILLPLKVPLLTALPLKTEVTSKMPKRFKMQYSYYNCSL